MNRLMIGPGQHSREGWSRLDAVGEGLDFQCTIPPLPDGVKATVWDEIEWIHGITSLYPWDACDVAVELRDVLRPGTGKLVLEQPDFRKCSHVEKWLFGDPEFRNPLHMNRWSYTPESLSALLREAGFTRIELRRALYHVPERDFRIEAYA